MDCCTVDNILLGIGSVSTLFIFIVGSSQLSKIKRNNSTYIILEVEKELRAFEDKINNSSFSVYELMENKLLTKLDRVKLLAIHLNKIQSQRKIYCNILDRLCYLILKRDININKDELKEEYSYLLENVIKEYKPDKINHNIYKLYERWKNV